MKEKEVRTKKRNGTRKGRERKKTVTDGSKTSL